ncbi:hypothetical protein GCM10028808_59690 [Spirosoma migulaei]
MRNTFDPYTWYNNLYFRWTALPVLAHMFSWMTGIGGVLLFPILITVAQYLIFKVHPAVARPGFWFVTLPITFICWVKWGPFITSTQSGGIIQGVTAYYIGQLVIALFIPLIIKPERPEFLLNWIGCTITSGLGWVVLYWFVTGMQGNKVNIPGNVTIFLIYPAIALIANSASGFFLLKE